MYQVYTYKIIHKHNEGADQIETETKLSSCFLPQTRRGEQTSLKQSEEKRTYEVGESSRVILTI